MVSTKTGKKEPASNFQVIAIDGPAGAGKSTIARLLAKSLGYLYVDTGALYRALTFKAIRNGLDLRDEASLIRMAQTTTIDLKNKKDSSLEVILDGVDITKEIRDGTITKIVSDIARIKRVRLALLEKQRAFAKKYNVVVDGRDIGTVVFPNADFKFYLDAGFKERVKRRFKELEELGQSISEREVEQDLKYRDRTDSTRKVAPLRQAEDALYIDTTEMSIEEVVNKLLEHIKGS